MKILNLLTEVNIEQYNSPKFVHDIESAIESNGSSFVCSYVASAIKMLGGNRVKVYGFSNERNPTATYFRDEDDPDEGHHFAVLDNRYIIDPWIYNNYQNPSKTFNKDVFDLQNKNSDNLKLIQSVYGDPKTWINITNSTPKFEQLFPKTVGELKNIKLFNYETF